MENHKEIKRKLFETCMLFVERQHKTVIDIIELNKTSLFSETKSSAGDKHETGRAMLQLEMEKASQQLTSINQMKEVLSKISTENTSDIVCLGSLILTSKENYYLSISIGKITINNIDYYAVSTNSPIGQQLLGKRVKSIIPFNNAEISSTY